MLRNLFALVFAIFGSYPFFVMEGQRAAARPHHIKCSIPGYVIADFWTTNNRAVTVQWSTNLSATGFAYSSCIVTNPIW